MKLIREEIESVDFIVEEKNGKKNMFIEGIFLQGDLKNRNGRMYPMETLRREVQRYTENHVNSGRALENLDTQMAQLLIWIVSVTKLFRPRKTVPTLSVRQKSCQLRWVRSWSLSSVRESSWVFLLEESDHSNKQEKV